MFPIPQRERRTSDGFAQAGSLNQSGPLIPIFASSGVDRTGRGVEQVDEAERRGHRRDQRREVEDGAEEADAALRARQHDGDAEGEDDLERNHDRAEPEGVLDRRPDLRVGAEQVAVVGETDPARRVEEVVVGEREVHAHHERVAEEDGEAEQPGAHEEQHGAASAPGCAPLGPPAVDHRGRRGQGARRRPGCRRNRHGTPPPVCFSFASICLSTSARPPWRSFALPDCHLARKVWKVSR